MTEFYFYSSKNVKSIHYYLLFDKLFIFLFKTALLKNHWMKDYECVFS